MTCGLQWREASRSFHLFLKIQRPCQCLNTWWSIILKIESITYTSHIHIMLPAYTHTSSTYIQTHTHTNKYTCTYTHTTTHTCHVYTNHNKHVMYCSSGIRNTHPLIPRLAPLLVVQQAGHGQHVETILMRVDGSIDIMRRSFKNSKTHNTFQ